MTQTTTPVKDSNALTAPKQKSITHISVRGARTHNLKNLDIDIPHNQLVVITGLSGSGKSSLAFDTIYAEGQRRYVESLSSYARQFLSLMEKPDIDSIAGLSPAISIDQKSTSHNPRSTVGTITEVYDYLRLLFARIGLPHCPTHKLPLHAQTIKQMLDKVMQLEHNQRLMILSPVVRDRKGEYLQLIEGFLSQGFLRARIDGEIVLLEEMPKLDPNKRHTIELVIDRFRLKDDIRGRLSESIETALRLSKGLVMICSLPDPENSTTEKNTNKNTEKNADKTSKKNTTTKATSQEPVNLLFSENHSCTQCGFSIADLAPRLFSFNSPYGACNRCEGIGTIEYFSPELVVASPNLSLSAGAIPGWDKRSQYYFELLKHVAWHYEFSVDTPFNELTDQQQKIILHGSGKEKLELPGGRYQRRRIFEGVIPQLERRYRETDIKQVRENLNAFRIINNCPNCQGGRLNPAASHVLFEDHNISQICQQSIRDCHQFFQSIQLQGSRKIIADKIVNEISSRLKFLNNVGLGYLTLARSANTLSGGEAQRIRLASQIGAGLVGVMYVLDEPSIGLHQRDNEKLLQTLCHLRDIGNTVIVVEHDKDTINNADFIIDIGPKAGVHGGELVACGSKQDICNQPQSITGDYLSNRRTISIPKKRLPFAKERQIKIHNAKINNLQNLTATIPCGLMTCVTGVSGSGKSTLINQTLYPVAAHLLNRANSVTSQDTKITGLEHFDKVVNIDQSPIGRTPRSNPATYVDLFTPIRDLFAATKDARARGYKAGRFSFNVKGGRCEVCQGDGVTRVEMHFLADVFVKCDVCKGKRYNEETLSVLYKGKNIAEILGFTIEEGYHFFEAIPAIARKLKTLKDVGLGYIKLGQSSTTLSGGEAQRIKLAKELSRRDTGRTLYILDEPTTGLHFYDVELLIKMLLALRDKGNTLIIIEHNLDIIKTADWIIDLGPEGGSEGGNIIATGTPEKIAKNTQSHTARFIKQELSHPN